MLSQIPVAVDYSKAGVPVPAVPAALKLMILPNLEAITLRPERPLVLVVPGGGYNHVSAREAEAVALKFLAEGIHAAVLRYSVAPSRWPVAALELAWSLQYIRAHAEIWHVRPDAISVCGFSAGGHLAGTLGTLWNEPLFARVLGGGASWRPDAQILCYSVLTLGEFTHPGTRNCLLGLPTDPDNQLHLQEALSLETRVTPETPPTFLWHTVEDDTVPVENSLLYAAACRRNGVPFELHIYEHGGHGISTCQEITSTLESQIMPDNASWVPHAVRFLLRHWSEARS